jgi:hypothetical protein
VDVNAGGCRAVGFRMFDESFWGFCVAAVDCVRFGWSRYVDCGNHGRSRYVDCETYIEHSTTRVSLESRCSYEQAGIYDPLEVCTYIGAFGMLSCSHTPLACDISGDCA